MEFVERGEQQRIVRRVNANKRKKKITCGFSEFKRSGEALSLKYIYTLKQGLRVYKKKFTHIQRKLKKKNFQTTVSRFLRMKVATGCISKNCQLFLQKKKTKQKPVCIKILFVL